MAASLPLIDPDRDIAVCFHISSRQATGVPEQRMTRDGVLRLCPSCWRRHERDMGVIFGAIVTYGTDGREVAIPLKRPSVGAVSGADARVDTSPCIAPLLPG